MSDVRLEREDERSVFTYVIASACFEDYAVVAFGVAQGNGLKIVNTEPTGSSYGFCVKKGAGNDKLVEMFNRGLANIKANGKYREILDKYLKAK